MTWHQSVYFTSLIRCSGEWRRLYCSHDHRTREHRWHFSSDIGVVLSFSILAFSILA